LSDCKGRGVLQAVFVYQQLIKWVQSLKRVKLRPENDKELPICHLPIAL
jgi:hypothetical protein